MSNTDSEAMRHVLPALPYDFAALEPHIDARTMKLHHDMHHASYVEKLNVALKDLPELHQRTAIWLLLNLAAVPEGARTVVRNNAGGHVNHSLFWRAMSPQTKSEPGGMFADAVKASFGSLEKLQEQFDAAGASLFGSGWVWLVRTQQDHGKLAVITTVGHDNPMTQGHFPMLLNDVWEHAYYLKHENRRADYLKGWWSLVDWAEAGRRFENSGKSPDRRWDADGGLVLAPAA